MWEVICWNRDSVLSNVSYNSRSEAYENAHEAMTDNNVTAVEIYGPDNTYDSCQC